MILESGLAQGIVCRPPSSQKLILALMEGFWSCLERISGAVQNGPADMCGKEGNWNWCWIGKANGASRPRVLIAGASAELVATNDGFDLQHGIACLSLHIQSLGDEQENVGQTELR